jgi:hypothetical protein
MYGRELRPEVAHWVCLAWASFLSPCDEDAFRTAWSVSSPTPYDWEGRATRALWRELDRVSAERQLDEP